MIASTISHYRILERLGSGGMGVVYRAHDSSLGRDVALKTLLPEMASDPESVRRFEQEVRVVAALQHPNIVTIHSVEQADDTRFFTMELVSGRTLKSMIPEGGFEARRLLELATPLADAIAAAHERGITHRDLKPANVMVSEEGVPKILDFGLAKFRPPAVPMTDEEATRIVSSREIVLGTPPYMSPEQVRGRNVDQRSDVFSLGVMLYEMAVGRPPFVGETPAELVASILRDRPRFVCSINERMPLRLAILIEHCLEKDPEARSPSAADVRDQLVALAQGDDPRRRPIRSIAVRPFTDLSEAGDQDHLGEGIAEELIHRLARIETLRVASRTSSFACDDRNRPVTDMARELGVDTVLEGSVRRSGTRLRITAQIIDGASGHHRWSERFDRETADVFDVQDEIAESIVRELKIELTPGEKRSLSGPMTDDFQAYEYYLRGRRLLTRYRKRGMEGAIQMFALAVQRDPSFALAHAGLADCASFLYLYSDRSASSFEEADRASRRALELDPGLAAAHVSRGQILSLGGRTDEAEREFETALRLSPRLFEAAYLYARHCFSAGELAKAARLFERACELAPDDYQAPLLVAQIYDHEGRGADAVTARRRGVELVEERLKRVPDDVRGLYMGANGLAMIGEPEKCLEWTELALSLEPDDPLVLYNVACIHSLLGRTESAMELLERAVAAGLAEKGWIENDSNLDPLRETERYRQLLDSLD
jgi:non-specific serine/threonine protein kinase